MADESASITSALARLASEIYADVGSPAAKHVGSALETVFKIGLSPAKLLDWGYEKSKDWLAEKVRARLAQTPPMYHVSPPYSIAVAAISGVASNVDAPELRDLFAELLLKALDSRTATTVHPAYLTLLSQLSAQEALILVSLKKAGLAQRQGDCVFMERRGMYSGDSTDSIEVQFARHCESIGLPDNSALQVWLDNLERLALLKVDRHADINLVPMERERINAQIQQAEYRYLHITDFGDGFLTACTPIIDENAP